MQYIIMMASQNICSPSSSVIITSVLLLLMVTPQVVTDSITTLKASTHSTVSSLIIATVNDCEVVCAGTFICLMPPM